MNIAWYCPPGIDAPAHCPHPAGVATLPGHGPDVEDGGPGGGVTYGPPYQPGQDGWRLVPAGWYVRLPDNLRPQDCLRLEPHPRILRWHDLPGDKGHWWRIPVLITPLLAHSDARGYVSAVERVLAGTWTDPGDLAGLLGDLRRLAADQAPEDGRQDWLTVVIERILALGYAGLTRHEMAAAGWWTETWQARVVFLACDRPDLAEDVVA